MYNPVYLMQSETQTYLSEPTLDDLMRHVIETVRSSGESIRPTKGAAVELTGVLLELTNPLARLSRTETRGKPYSCLGELSWYLAGTNKLDFIFYYLPAYKEFADDGEVFGGYGPRLFDWRGGINQIFNVTQLLADNPFSRKAVVQLFDASDILEEHSDVPCTCTLQFVLRGGKLHLFTNMRSNDVMWGMPHDFFCFTMLQEIVARSLGAELGTYKHFVGSLHVYEKSMADADRFLGEGWQSTTPMPPMPTTDPWPSITLLQRAESSIRKQEALDGTIIGKLDPYWADFVRLLQVFACKKRKDPEGMKALRNEMYSNIYSPFIDRAISRLE